MNTLSVKKSAAEDTDFIYELEKSIFLSYRSRESISYCIADENSLCYTAFLDENPVGYITCKNIYGEIDIDNIAVNENLRKKGIGNKLMENLISYAQNNEIEFCTLEVRASNTPAIALYEKFGFELVARRKNYYTSPSEDALIYTKFLNAEKE